MINITAFEPRLTIAGANSGVGFATAKTIVTASPNYHVIIGSRSL
jgi:NADP-dependent 3-hydroxy acid dehydrogenase YdfG